MAELTEAMARLATAIARLTTVVEARASGADELFLPAMPELAELPEPPDLAALTVAVPSLDVPCVVDGDADLADVVLLDADGGRIALPPGVASVSIRGMGRVRDA